MSEGRNGQTTGQRIWSAWTRKHKKRMNLHTLRFVNRLSDPEHLQQLEEFGHEKKLDTEAGFNEALAQAAFSDLAPALGLSASDLLNRTPEEHAKMLASIDIEAALRVALGDSADSKED